MAGWLKLPRLRILFSQGLCLRIILYTIAIDFIGTVFDLSEDAGQVENLSYLRNRTH